MFASLFSVPLTRFLSAAFVDEVLSPVLSVLRTIPESDAALAILKSPPLTAPYHVHKLRSYFLHALRQTVLHQDALNQHPPFHTAVSAGEQS